MKRQLVYLLSAICCLFFGSIGAWAYNSDWEYTTTAKDEGQQSDGGNYTFRYNSSDTKGNFMGFKTYYMFDATKGMFKWNWDIKVNYGNVDNGNKTKVYVTIEYADGSRTNIAEAEFVGYNSPTVTSVTRPVFFSRIHDSGEFKYMFTLEYQPTDYDVRNVLRRIYIQCRTEWNGGKKVRNFQYERDLDISSLSKLVPSYSAELDGEGNVVFKADGAAERVDNIINRYFWFCQRDYSKSTKTFALNSDSKVGGSGTNTSYAVKLPVNFYTIPTRLYAIDFVTTARNMVNGQEGTIDYIQETSKDDAYYEGILLKPYTRAQTVTAEFDRWAKKNVIQWTRKESVQDYVGQNSMTIQCQTDGTWYVLRYEKGQPANSYVVVDKLGGNSKNLKVTDSDIDYDKDYIYRVVFLPQVLEANYSGNLTNLPAEGTRHTQYDLWEEQGVSTAFDLPIRLQQDVTDLANVRLVWDYNVQLTGLDWNIERRSAGETTWTRLDNLPLDSKQSSASYVTDGSVCLFNDYRITTTINGKDFSSNILSANLPAGSYISQVKASTGTETNHVVVKWKVERADQLNDIWYRVLRRPIGGDEWTLLNDEIHGTASEYSYIDDRAMAGSYYEYTVLAYGAKCDDQLVQTDAKVTPGFAQSTGTITGHISYGSGTAVGGVRVNLVKSAGADETTTAPQYLSRYIDGQGQGLAWTADSAKYASVLCGSRPLTLQLWARPALNVQRSTLLNFGNVLELGVINSGSGYHLTAIDKSKGGTNLVEFANMPFEPGVFTHIAATYSNGEWTFHLVSDSLRTVTMSVDNPKWNAIDTQAPTLTIGGGNRSAGDAYIGYVDDVRLWNRALTQSEILSNHTRILGGTEQGLLLYWPLDEGLNVRDYVFDVACQDGIYQQNHPAVGVNTQPSPIVPNQLKLYGITDDEGDYIIRGIPFQQGGTNYKIVPELGIHEFAPNTRSMFVSPTSLTANNIDFEDVSSFPMAGYAYYAGTNIPAEGLMLYVDGLPQSKDGKSITTDAQGYYELSVPIGNHYVECKLEGHKMVNGGRFPIDGTYDFSHAMTYDFADSTLVNFVGRVGGGLSADTLAVGFGASKNNIGIATIKLALNNQSLSFNILDDHITDATSRRIFPSDTTAIASHAWTGTGSDSHFINIRTDSLTGEFSALLPPLKYIVKSVKVDRNEHINFDGMSELDLTNPSKVLTDSLNAGITAQKGGDPTYSYHTKQLFTHYADPQISVVETANGEGAYGISEISHTDKDGIAETVKDLWKREADGSVSYLLGFPIYNMGESYEYKLFGYEEYVNYDGSKPVKDIIPMNDQLITVSNEMSDLQKIIYKVPAGNTEFTPGQVYEMVDDEVQLGGDGYLTYRWRAGAPNITAPYTRHLLFTLQRNGRTYVPMEMDAVVLGNLTNGNNFVTKGPDNVQFVLRDPYGAKSKTSLTKGRSHTYTKYETYERYGTHSLVNNIIVGSKHVSGAGFGFIEITGHENKGQFDVGFNSQWEYTHNKDSTHVVTTVENVSTGTTIPYVGSKGDVYVGLSTNLLIGTCRNLYIKHDPQSDRYAFDVENAISVGDSIGTAFKYTQYELETVMIPKWKDMRRGYLTEVSSAEEAKNYVNNLDHCVYVTWKGLDLDTYEKGLDKDYLFIEPKNVITSEIDSVEWCTMQIQHWENIIRDNEEDKVETMKRSNPENISIDGGSSFTYSTTEKTSKNHLKKTNWKVGAVLGTQFGWQTSFFAHLGFITTVKSDEGGGEIEGSGTVDEHTTTWEYSLVDGNRDTDLSINIYKSSRPGYSDIFSVFGGQTYNPYQPQEVTHYYNPGTPLGNSTQQMEQPDLKIGVGNQQPSKVATLTDIPAGGEANVTLYCTNNATAHQGLNFSYNFLVIEQSNDKGLQILMDGVPINGRSIMLAQGETTQKVITIRQTDPSILDYKGIRIRFTSQYQAPIIYDEVTLNAHFVPASAPIDLVIEEPVVNSSNTTALLQMKLENLDRSFKGLEEVGIEYRYEGNRNWNVMHRWVTDSASLVVGNSAIEKLPLTGDILLTESLLSDVTYPEGTYTLRAYTATLFDTASPKAYSNEVTVVKDMTRPRNLTTPTPTNGILRYGDDMGIEFTEDIVPGYVDDKNVIVTAKLNDQPVNHEVALSLNAYGLEAHTENPIFLSGDFSLDMWFIWHEGGILLRHGKGPNATVISIDDAGHLVIKAMGSTYTSSSVVAKDQWTYLVLSFNAELQQLSALAQYGEQNQSVFLFDRQKMVMGSSAVQYAEDNYFYIDCDSSLYGAMHDLSLFKIYRDVNLAAATKYQSKNSYVYGLTNYWPMNEGHGRTVTDTRHTHNFLTRGSWTLSNTNYSLNLVSTDGATADIATLNTSNGDSYAIELWASIYGKHGQVAPKNEAVLFETGRNENDRLRLYYKDSNLLLDYGKQTRVMAESVIAEPLEWHHMALNVVRGQSASFYLDGKRVAVIAERDLPNVQGAEMKIGHGFAGYIDELRYWRASLSETRLLANQWNCIDTTDVFSRGLALYLPFEKSATVNGVKTKVFTLENMAPSATANHQLAILNSQFNENTYTPPLKNAPEEVRLIAAPIASERKIVVNLKGTTVQPRDIEGTTLNITVDKIYDKNGNESLPIRWTAYVQQNTLKWTRDSVVVIKKYGDAYTFDVNIENKSGQTEYYSIENLPAWLSLVSSETNDAVGPLSAKTLRFRVDPMVHVGNFDVTIGLQGNLQILEPLRVVMKVQAERPDWAVNTRQFEHQMTIIGQVRLNGFLMENEESIVAAFIDGECRGVASPETVNGASFITMTVFGNDGKPTFDYDKPITYRIWDATTGIIYSDASLLDANGSPVSTTFCHDLLWGGFDNPFIWTPSGKVEQAIPLGEGWNWMSLGVEPESKFFDKVFYDYRYWSLIVKSQQMQAQNMGVEWFGKLKQIDANTMYKVNITRNDDSGELPAQLTVTGTPVVLKDTPIQISKDWNWIAYTPTATMSVGEALAGLNPQQGDRIKSQTAIAIYNNGSWSGNLKTLESGKGYVYFSTDPQTKQFVYPAAPTTLSARSELSERPASAAESLTFGGRPEGAPAIFTPVDWHPYPDNMTMVIQLRSRSGIVDTCQVAAFIDGECRGEARADGGLYYLVVMGEGGMQTMELKTCFYNKIVTIDTSQSYTSDANIGQPWAPYVIDVSAFEVGITDVEAAPTDNGNGWWTLQGLKLDNRPGKAGVYIHNGKKISVKPYNRQR